MTELELIVKNLDKIGTELYSKFGTDSYNIRCELHDIKEQLKAINYSRCCKSDSEQLCEHPMSERADIVNSSRTYCLKCSTTL